MVHPCITVTFEPGDRCDTNGGAVALALTNRIDDGQSEGGKTIAHGLSVGEYCPLATVEIRSRLGALLDTGCAQPILLSKRRPKTVVGCRYQAVAKPYPPADAGRCANLH